MPKDSKELNNLWLELSQLTESLSHETQDKNQEELQQLFERQNQIIFELKEAFDQSQAANYENLIGELAHELNTPIGICISVSSVLSSDAKALEDQFNNGIKRSELDQFIHKNSDGIRILTFNLQRAKNLIKNYCFLGEKSATDFKEKVNLQEFFREICESLKPKIKQNDHVIKISCSDKLSLNTYFDYLSQVMVNLIMNSIKHGFHDKSHGLIEINCQQQEGYISIEFKDNGVGITEDILPNIFAKNFTHSQAAGGKGLGLHIVKKIIESDLGGSVDVKSSVGKGTIFNMKLPNS